jgi:hypothetical protein
MKYQKVLIDQKTKETVCPYCGKKNDHLRGNYNHCDHLFKLTKDGVAFYTEKRLDV